MHIKSVVQALPAFSMSCFKVTKGLCGRIMIVMSKYWWAGSLDKKCMHWQAWPKMATPKSKGGLGFRDLELFNDAMLAKQAWRLLVDPESLCARVLKSKYYPNGNLLDTVFASDASPVWRAIEFGLELLKTGII